MHATRALTLVLVRFGLGLGNRLPLFPCVASSVAIAEPLSHVVPATMCVTITCKHCVGVRRAVREL